MNNDTPETIQLNWTQPSALERHFELRSTNSVLVGVLHFEKAQTACGAVLNENTETDRWIFEDAGFLKKARMIIRKAGATEAMAIYHPHFWGDGWFKFVKGNRFHWKSKGFWGRKWGFFNEQEELLYSLTPNFFDLLKIQSCVTVNPKWRDLEELPLLLLLGWYVKVRDSYAGR